MPVTDPGFGSRLAAWEATHRSTIGVGEAGDRTLSDLEIASLYTRADRDLATPDADVGLPGEFPFTRGTTAAGYRDHLWVMGQYSGYGSPKETNARIKRLIAEGQKGFSIALDLPTQLGLDSDDPRAEGEVGKVGVPIDALQDMVELLDGIPLEHVRQIRTTANAIAPIALALFVAAAEVHGYRPDQFKVMFQNDVLKEYVARGTYIFPPEKGRRFSVDVIEYCAEHIPTWEPIEFCGYHLRDSGANAIQEIAIASANGIAYIDDALARGLDIDEFGESLYMFLSAHLDLFEEVAKFRAARRFWARLLKSRYGAHDDACRLNIFVYTLGSPQTAQEPLNNIVRIAYQAMAAVLGGVQTIATSAYDEAVQLPSDEAARISLRTQQILAYETGVPRSVDPLGGSYLVEDLTDRLEVAVQAEFDRIQDLGGAVAALESGWIAAQLEDEAYAVQRAIEDGDRVVVGVNRFAQTEDAPLRHRMRTDPSLERTQVERLRTLRAERDAGAVDAALGRVGTAAAGTANTVPSILEAVRAHATVGEICTALKAEWGVHRA
ncbi:methylmalonyl-CoA mutase [Patulibacter sp.]|uniref:acyl-CoA mutase large subunit family protein n=1 Tax=Patulibacter sp. TaxID=1912859 RepID=UPI00271D47CE|nr:methylmalonyl-CoA mutase family protein [Patulibacter sp.]MDO9409013.1 methylmalonyl-CoA mutase family protein [Patulibacter sp.]